MSDWQVGDLAVCVDDAPHPVFATGLTRGAIYTVTGIVPPSPWYLDESMSNVGLELAEAPCETPMGWACERFRKIRPDEHQACEPEFVTLLRKSKQKVPTASEWLLSVAALAKKLNQESLGDCADAHRRHSGFARSRCASPPSGECQLSQGGKS